MILSSFRELYSYDVFNVSPNKIAKFKVSVKNITN